MKTLNNVAKKNLEFLRKINSTILNIEFRLNLNAQSLIHSDNITLKNRMAEESIEVHNQRAQEAIDECNSSLEKLSYLQLNYRRLPQDQLFQLLANYQKMEFQEIQEIIEQGKTPA